MKPHELVFELVKRGGGSLPVAKAMGVPNFQGTLHKIAAGQVLNPKRPSAERIAKHFRIPVDAIYDERVATHIWRKIQAGEHLDNGLLLSVAEHSREYTPAPVSGVAQSVSDLSPITLPTMTWEAVMGSAKLPAVFILAMRDDALAPRVRAGDEVIWSTTKPPKIGAPILVRTASGGVYVRRMYEGAGPDHFIARVKSDAYRALDSEADGLQILAVYAGRIGDFEEA